MKLRTPKLFLFSILLLSSGFATTATSVAASSDIEQQQETAFAAVIANPQDVEAMLSYARLSVKLRDYEAAISTLERLLDMQPENQDVRFELAIAYQALGNMQLAKYHFGILKEGGSLNADERETLDRYEIVADQNLSGHKLNGYAALGVSIAEGEDQAEATLNFGLRWRQDLNLANKAWWQTDLRGALYHLEDGFDIDRSRVLIRAGPIIGLSDLSYGAKIRPYLELDRNWDQGFEDRLAVSAGVQYTNTHNAYWSSYAAIEAGKNFALDASADTDSTFISGMAGVTYRPSRDTRLRFSVHGDKETGEVAANSRNRIGLRAGFTHEFDSGFDWAKRKWRFDSYAQYDVYDFINDPGDRMDYIVTAGASLRAYMKRDYYAEIGTRVIKRDSTEDTLDLTTRYYHVLIGVEF